MLSPHRIKRDGIFDPQAVTALVSKFKARRETSTKDNMALVGILSTQILLDQFVYSQGQRGARRERNARRPVPCRAVNSIIMRQA